VYGGTRRRGASTRAFRFCREGTGSVPGRKSVFAYRSRRCVSSRCRVRRARVCVLFVVVVECAIYYYIIIIFRAYLTRRAALRYCYYFIGLYRLIISYYNIIVQSRLSRVSIFRWFARVAFPRRESRDFRFSFPVRGFSRRDHFGVKPTVYAIIILLYCLLATDSRIVPRYLYRDLVIMRDR